MDEIIRFVRLAQSARFTVSEPCEQFGISRKTGYKHLDRYAADGLKGLAVRSHRPHQFPQRTEGAVEALILAERRLHRTCGPKKLHKVLEVKHLGLSVTYHRLAPTLITASQSITIIAAGYFEGADGGD